MVHGADTIPPPVPPRAREPLVLRRVAVRLGEPAR
jgi:hypothetical protein